MARSYGKTMLIYDGPSLLDGEPIIVVAVPDYSKKVGTMLLTWIILRDVDPRSAAYDGRDESICGGCVFRAKKPIVLRGGSQLDRDHAQRYQRACYVRPHLEPWIIWTKYHDDEYPDMTAIPEWGGIQWRRQVNPTRMPVRIGSYGDPAVVPVRIWKTLVATADRYTGYTHMWDSNEVDPELKKYCMASVDDVFERERAQDKGWRTFLVTKADEKGLEPRESVLMAVNDDILCPASNLGGSKTTCDKCRLCQGTTVACEKSIWIPAHGPGKEFV